MDLSIIIVNWKSIAYLEKCLPSIRSGVGGLKHEIIVVDNASYDGSEDLVRTKFPDVTFVQSRHNTGFSRANNLGFTYSSGRTLLFLNPDTVIIDNAIEVMHQYLWSLPNAGVTGARLLNADMSVQTNCIQSLPSISNQVLACEFLRKRFPRLGLWRLGPLYCDGRRPERVDVVSGACLMIKRAVFEEVGIFSTDYFLYAEEVDLCYRVAMAGYGNYFIGEAKVLHYGGQSSSQRTENAFSAVVMRDSVSTFFKKTKGSLYAMMYRAATGMGALVRLLVLAAAYPFGGLMALDRIGIARAARKWRAVLGWSLRLKRSPMRPKPRTPSVERKAA